MPSAGPKNVPADHIHQYQLYSQEYTNCTLKPLMIVNHSCDSLTLPAAVSKRRKGEGAARVRAKKEKLEAAASTCSDPATDLCSASGDITDPVNNSTGNGTDGGRR